jgi:hypothetical protein
MPIEKGKERGFLNIGKTMKVLLGDEGIWVKVIAMHNDRTKAVGILMNKPFADGYDWGDFVRIEEVNPQHLAQIVGHSSKIPNSTYWRLI